METIIGIDLGTTYSEVAVVGPDSRPKLVKNPSGKEKTDSALWLKQDGTNLIGSQARRMKPLEPERVLWQTKPEWDDSETVFSIHGSPQKPTYVATQFYKALKEQAESNLGEKIEKAVISVPAYFHDVGYELMVKGAEEAGLEVVRVLREPAAAATGYAIREALKDGEIILVYDLGGGTFDVSVLEVAIGEGGESDIKVRRNEGDTQLGGRIFDRLIMEEVLISQFKKENGLDPTGDPQVEARWLEEAEQLKKDLSQSEKSTAYLQGKGESSAVSLSRADFTQLIQPKIDYTLKIVERTLDKTGLAPADVDRLVFVGGSTWIPAVRQQVSDFLHIQPADGVDPDEAVVVGDALVGGIIAGVTPRNEFGEKVSLLESSIQDVTSHCLGVRAVDRDTGEYFHEIIIKAGDPLPASGTKMFQPTNDDASEVEITLLEGDSKDLNTCRVLQEGYKLPISNPRSADLVRVQVELLVNKNGLILIRARTQDGDEMEERFEHPSIAD